MFIHIPGWFISLITFPGIIVHEIAHQFFCDIGSVPVFSVHYFIPFKKVSGLVVHQPAKTLRNGILIAIAPLILNTLVCLLFTIPAFTIFHLGTSFDLANTSLVLKAAMILLAWVGLSAGFHAIPSNLDMQGIYAIGISTDFHAKPNTLQDMLIVPKSFIGKAMLRLLVGAVWFANLPFLGFFVRFCYAIVIASLIPALLVRILV